MPKFTLELNVNSASDLEDANHITKMNVYAVVTLLGEKNQKKQKVKTSVARSGGSNPSWNHSVEFSVDERSALEGHSTLVVKLLLSRFLGDKDIGTVEVSLLDLLSSNNGNGHGVKFVTYQVRTPSQRMKGSLTFSYRFNGAPIISGQAYHQAAPMWAPPSQQGVGPYGYMPLPPPPQQGYGYGGPRPPQGYGYGVPPPPQQLTKNEARLEKADTFLTAISLLS